MTTIYLAGPDVFLPDAARVAEQKQQACRAFGFEGLSPLDAAPAVETTPGAIFRANCALMERADLAMCNLTPFRGVSADAGTAFELGFLFARGKPVYGYSSIPLPYRARVAAMCGPLSAQSARTFDRDGYGVEDFDLFDNLMLAEAIAASGGSIIVAADEEECASGALPAFTAFHQCLKVIAARIDAARHGSHPRR